MFDKEIIFSTHKNYVDLKEDYPTPIKLNIPEWFKQIKHSFPDRTIKGCMPFLDALTSGYLLKIPQDFQIRHNFLNSDGKKDSFSSFGLNPFHEFIKKKGINLNVGTSSHPIEQLSGSPLIDKNKNLPFYKISNPWKIKTPKGYSCLFVPPLNNSDDRFSIISGIVDTDTYENEVNFPIVINGDKYDQLDTIIKKGTPYVQIIPFKRDSWKMKIKEEDESKILNRQTFYHLELINKYKNTFWKKKSWK